MKVSGKYDPHFKLEVVQLIREQGLSVNEVAKTMGVGKTALRRWVAQYDGKLEGGSGLGRPLTVEQQRIRALERENQQLRSDNELLKKASAFFARELK